MNLSDEELAQLAEFLRGWTVDEESIELGMERLFDLGRYELAERSLSKLLKLVPAATVPIELTEQ